MTGCKESNQKHVNTFIFDHCNTIVTPPYATELLRSASHEDEALFHAVSQQIADGFAKKYPSKLIMANVKKSTGIVVMQKDFEYVASKMANYITKEMKDEVTSLINAGHNVFIVGGRYNSCYIISKTAKILGIPERNVFAGKFNGFEQDKIDNFLDHVKFVQCSDRNSREFESKERVVEYLKQINQIEGKTIVIGKSSPDLNMFKSGHVDEFIAFQVNYTDLEVAQYPGITVVKNMNEFHKAILRWK